MEIKKIGKTGEDVKYCAYCDSITFMEKFDGVDGSGKPMFICKTCNMEAAQLEIQFKRDTYNKKNDICNR